MQTSKIYELLMNNLDINQGAVLLHFTESIPSTEEVKAYTKMGLSRVIWVQPYTHLQKEMYESTAVHALPSQHICLPNWVLDGIDNVFTLQRVYIELEKIQTVSLMNVKSTESVSNILQRMKKTLSKETSIKNIIIRSENVNAEAMKILAENDFTSSMQFMDINVYSRILK